jgi:MFS family permease
VARVRLRDSVVAREVTFRRFWTARLLSMVGDGVSVTALVLYVQQVRGTGVAVAGLLLASGLPKLGGPVAGALADRFPQQRLMMTCDLGQAVIYGFIAAARPGYGLLLGLVAVAAALETVFVPAGRASVRPMVGDARLLEANAWIGSASNAKVALGPLLGGVLVAVAGSRWAVGLNAASFVLSAGLLWRMGPLTSAEDGAARRGMAAATWDGLAYAMRHRVIRPVILMTLGCSAFLVVDNIGLVFLTRDALHAGAVGYGVAAAAFGVGMVVLSVLFSIWQPARSPVLLFVAALAADGIFTVATGVAPILLLVVVFQAACGAGNAVENIAGSTLIQREVPLAMMGRVFGAQTTASYAASSLCYVAGGLLLSVVSPRALFVGGGVGALAVIAALSPALFRGRRPAEPAPDSAS